MAKSLAVAVLLHRKREYRHLHLAGQPSVLEVTPEKKIVWMLPKNYLGNSSSIQLLDEPGAMEDGDLHR
jgi:hypothetical protein